MIRVFRSYSTHKVLTTLVMFMVGVVLLQLPAGAQEQQAQSVSIDVRDGFRYISSYGIPRHAADRYETLGIKPTPYAFKVIATPKKASAPIDWRYGAYFGVALDGVPFTQGLVGQLEDNAVWLERFIKGADSNGGKKGPDGAYFYHRVPTALLDKDLTHVGYAADGFPIFVSRSGKFKPSYKLNIGERPEPPSGPGGPYDGAYINDYIYAPKSGNLDKCNGITVQDKYYIYILTEEFPQIPLCWSGEPDNSFMNVVQDDSGDNAVMRKGSATDIRRSR